MIRELIGALLSARRHRKFGHAWRDYHRRESELWGIERARLERDNAHLRRENAALLEGNLRLMAEIEAAGTGTKKSIAEGRAVFGDPFNVLPPERRGYGALDAWCCPSLAAGGKCTCVGDTAEHAPESEVDMELGR